MNSWFILYSYGYKEGVNEMVTITKAALEKIHEEMEYLDNQDQDLFLRLGLGLG